MPWDLSNDRPIYLQLMERIQQDIVSGVYSPVCAGAGAGSSRQSQHHAEGPL